MEHVEIGMDPKKIAEQLQKQFSSEVKEIAEYNGQIAVIVGKKRIRDIVRYLHDTPSLSFDLLRDLCGVDYLGKKEPRFEVAYQLYSIEHRHFLRVRAEVPEDDCSIDSVVPVYAGANWHERECFDMFGITFKGHPDHRRILLPDDWEGHPLRKDYPLKSDLGAMEWKGWKEVLEVAEKNKQFEVR